MKLAGYEVTNLNNGFLYEKQKLNKDITMDAVYKRFTETGRIDAFNCNWKEGDDKKPHCYWDSDVAKWIEGAAYILQKENDRALEEKVEKLIDAIELNQGDDGYFNIYFTVCEPEKRFSDRNMHELYCAGHIFEAAVAYYEATGKDRLLRVAEKYADYIEKVFIYEKSSAFQTPGHEEIELALIRLYRATGKTKYLKLAAHFINKRGNNNEKGIYTPNNDYASQSHLPVREQLTAEGHCVRACYLYSAMADLAYETNDKELYNVCKAVFSDIVNKKMYITGGIGSSRILERFTVAYDLKNAKAYAETCAAISLMFFAHRMMRFENNSIYADIIEKILYNGMISGLSLSGDEFFYENPLEITLRDHMNDGEPLASPKREKVFFCSCCPPNLNRVLASLGSYIYGYEKDTVYVNQFVGSSSVMENMEIIQEADFPKSGKISFITKNIKKLCVRIPQWCRHFELNSDYTLNNGYAEILNPSSKKIVLTLSFEPILIQSNTEVYENSGKAAIICGPYVCAAEGIDNTENLHSIFIDKNFLAKYKYSDDMSGFLLDVKAFKRKTDDSLYSEYNEIFEDFTLKMIPYASFANRGKTNMAVWLHVR